MSALSRRAALTAIAAAGAVPASVAAAACLPSDEELFELERDLGAAKTRSDEANKRYNEVEGRYFALLPKRPERKPPKEYLDLWATITVAQMAILTDDHPLKVWDREIDEEHEAKVRAYRAERKRLSELTGRDTAEAEYEERVDEMWEIVNRIYATRAHTLAGVMVKIRTVEHIDAEDKSDAWESVSADIRLLAGASA